MGRPSVSHSEYEPVTFTVVVPILMTKGSCGAPDDVAIALGAGFMEGTEIGVTLQGHVITCMSPKTLTSSLERRENPLVMKA